MKSLSYREKEFLLQDYVIECSPSGKFVSVFCPEAEYYQIFLVNNDLLVSENQQNLLEELTFETLHFLSQLQKIHYGPAKSFA